MEYCTCYNCTMIDEPKTELTLEQRLDIVEAMLKGVRAQLTATDWRLNELEDWAKRTNRKLK